MTTTTQAWHTEIRFWRRFMLDYTVCSEHGRVVDVRDAERPPGMYEVKLSREDDGYRTVSGDYPVVATLRNEDSNLTNENVVLNLY